MKKSRVLMSAATLAGICVIGASLTGFAALDGEEVNAVDAVAAIQGVVPESLSGLAAVSSDSDTAAAASLEGGRVEVPVDPADGLSLGDSVRIGLPFARQASDAADSQLPGVVAYDNKNGSTTVPLIKADGAVQINTVIDDASAPKRYEYPIDLPDGAALTVDANGTVAIAGASKGTYLRKYINGRMVQSLSLVYRGGAYVKPTWKSGCFLSLGGAAVALVWFPPAGVTAWVVTSAFAAAGIAGSCKGF